MIEGPEPLCDFLRQVITPCVTTVKTSCILFRSRGLVVGTYMISLQKQLTRSSKVVLASTKSRCLGRITNNSQLGAYLEQHLSLVKALEVFHLVLDQAAEQQVLHLQLAVSLFLHQVIKGSKYRISFTFKVEH